MRTASLRDTAGWGCSPTRASLAEAALAAGGLILGLAGCLWLGPLYVEAMRPAAGRVNDFFQDWGSARNFWGNLPIYAHHAASMPRHLGVPFSTASGIDYNAHPPTSVLLALPLAYLDFPDAVLAWNTVSLLAFLGSLGIVARALSVPRSLFLPVLALLIFCQPLFATLYQGQLTLILVLLLTAAWSLERSGRSYAPGILLGAAAAIKLFPAYLVVYFAAQRRWRSLLATAFSFGALTLTTVAVLGLDAYRDYVQVVLPAQTRFRGLGYNCAIAGFWYKLFDPAGEKGLIIPLWWSPALARIGTLVSDVAITLLVGTRAYRARTRTQQDLAFAAALTAMLLVSPVSWDISLPLLLVPIGVLVRSASRPRWMPVALFFAVGLIWMPQFLMTRLAFEGQSVPAVHWTFVLGPPSLKSYALLGLFALELTAFQTAKLPFAQLDVATTSGFSDALGFATESPYNDESDYGNEISKSGERIPGAPG